MAVNLFPLVLFLRNLFNLFRVENDLQTEAVEIRKMENIYNNRFILENEPLPESLEASNEYLDS